MTAQAGGTLIPDLAALKAVLRREQRRLRSAIPRQQKLQAARRAARQLLRVLQPHSAIAIYLSVRSELSTGPLGNALHRAGHRVHAPVTLRDSGMRFLPLRKNTPLRRSALALPQPVGRRSLRNARALDVILLPLLAFDAQGGRLGNGGGYYDRALARPRIGKRPRLIGYAYAAQEVAVLPREPWDVQLDAVVTERGLRTFK